MKFAATPATRTHSAPAESVEQAGSGGAAQIRGIWLVVARLAWLAVFALQVALTVVGMPPYIASTRGNSTYIVFMVGGQLLLTGFIWAMAALIFWRRASDRMALLASLALLLVGTLSPAARQAMLDVHSGWYLVSEVCAATGWASFFALFFALFPDGRFVPRWAAGIALGWYAINVPSLISDFDPQSPLLIERWPIPLTLVVLGGLIVLSIYAQVYRYRHVSGPAERQQTKWVIFAVVTGTVILVVPDVVGTLFPSPALPAYPADQYSVLGNIISAVGLAFIPTAFAVAIFRYRLWDIDVLINRALVYGSLTAVLAAVYFGLVIGLQAVSSALTGQTKPQPVLIVASTLLIAALFNPLRRRLQAFIDRRFYRRKYDATTTLARFGARLRSEVEMEQLEAHVVAVVEETMQPAHVSLWLNPPRGEVTP